MASRRTIRPATLCIAIVSAGAATIGLLPGAASAAPRPTIAQVQQRIDVLNEQAAMAAERYNDARVELAGVTQKLTKVQGRLSVQKARVGILQASMGELAAARYRAGGVDETLQLILSENPSAFLDQASSLDQIGRRQDDALRRVTVARQELAQDQLAVAQQLGQIAKVKKQLQGQRQAVEGKLAEAKRLLNSLRAEERARLLAAQRAAQLRALAAARAAAAARASRDDGRIAADANSGAENGGGASGGDTGGTTGGGDAPPDNGSPTYDGPASGRAAVAVRTAFAQLGDPYVWAAGGPGSFDCSGLTSYAWRAAGVSLPHSSRAQYASGRKVARSDLQPGDLVFFYHPISHVGIYIGGGRMIHAPHPGTGVQIGSIGEMSYAGAVRP